MLRIVGPGRFLLLGSGCERLAQALRKQSCAVEARAGETIAADGTAPDAQADTVLLCGDTIQNSNDPAALFQRLQSLARRFVALAPPDDWRRHGDTGTYAHWAKAAFSAGFRRAPSAFNVHEEREQSRAALRELVVFEKVSDAPDARAKAAPADFTRQTGEKADTAAALYGYAAEWVRSGDTVVALGSEGGSGCALLASQSRAARIIGVDADAANVAYASAQFGQSGDVEFLLANDPRYCQLPLADASADLITFLSDSALGVPFSALAPEVLRVLKPDGRVLIRSTRATLDDATTDTADAPAASSFIAEARYDLTPILDPQKRPVGTHIARKAPAETGRAAPQTVLVASRDPFSGVPGLSYQHPQFDCAKAEGSHLADFGAHYENPWIYRALVQMGERISDEQELTALALRTMNGATFATPDVGAALTVIGYGLLAQDRAGEADDWRVVTDGYLALPAVNPHMHRWQLSLAFCKALLSQQQGLRQQARTEFETVAAMDPLVFSPLLSTKVIAAAFWAGIMHLTDGATDVAANCFRAGIEAGRRALHASDENAIGNPQSPLSFGFQELAEVADMASQCTAALLNMPRFARSPGQFWRQVDVRRFGLATWAKNLEKENHTLREALRRKAA